MAAGTRSSKRKKQATRHESGSSALAEPEKEAHKPTGHPFVDDDVEWNFMRLEPVKHSKKIIPAGYKGLAGEVNDVLKTLNIPQADKVKNSSMVSLGLDFDPTKPAQETVAAAATTEAPTPTSVVATTEGKQAPTPPEGKHAATLSPASSPSEAPTPTTTAASAPQGVAPCAGPEAASAVTAVADQEASQATPAPTATPEEQV